MKFLTFVSVNTVILAVLVDLRSLRAASGQQSQLVSKFAQGQQKSFFFTISQQLLAKAPARLN